MKKLLIAVLLIPALGLAAEKPEEKVAAPAQTDPNAPPANTTATGSDKKDEKKDAPAATATTTATQAAQPAVNASLMTPEQLAAAGAWTFGVNLDNSVGSGTFANAAYYASVVSSLSASASKPFKLAGRSFMGSGSLNTSYEFTRPDNENGRRISWSDARFGLSMPGVYKNALTGISVNPSISVGIPLTLESWYAGSLSSVGANVRLIRQVGPVSLRLGFGGNYAINTSSYRVQRPVANIVQNGGPLCRASDPAGSCGSGGMTSLGGLNTNITALWFISDSLVAYGQFGIGSRWNNAATTNVDEFTPRGTQVDGRPVVYTGSVVNNTTSGALGVSYSLTDIFSVSGTISNDGPARTNDQKAFRFPFFDFRSQELSLTSYTVSLSATL